MEHKAHTMKPEFQINPDELNSMDQTAYLHLDNKIAQISTDFQTRMDGAETRFTFQMGSLRSEVTGSMKDIQGELKALNEAKSGAGGAKALIFWIVPLSIAVAQLLHDFRK